jgi:azurin
MKSLLVRWVFAAAVLLPVPCSAAQEEPVRILLDAAPRAIEYQLNRLTVDELRRVERKPGDPRYRLVYVALLTRKGLGREYMEEAVAVLSALDKASPVAVLLDAVAKVAPDDDEAADRLLRYLFSRPADAFRKDRERLAATAASAAAGVALRAAYGGLLIADDDVGGTWDAASQREGHFVELLRSIPALPADAGVREKLFDRIAALLSREQDPARRAAAVAALASTRADAATFKLLAQEAQSPEAQVRAAAVAALQRLPSSAWAAGDAESLARALVTNVGRMSATERTSPAGADAIALAEKLAAALPADSARALRRDIRALGVRIVRIETLPEKMQFDLQWFAVEAGKPVQIVFSNPDAMSHNLVITQPGALKEVATAGAAMPVPADPQAKAYVPVSPLVVQATRLLNWAEIERLAFTAPVEPGEYPFVCTFPGHWVRMYGVMVVVADIEAWEKGGGTPTDPMTGARYKSLVPNP